MFIIFCEIIAMNAIRNITMKTFSLFLRFGVVNSSVSSFVTSVPMNINMKNISNAAV